MLEACCYDDRKGTQRKGVRVEWRGREGVVSEEGGWRLRKRRSSCRVAGVLTVWSSREQQSKTALGSTGGIFRNLLLE